MKLGDFLNSSGAIPLAQRSIQFKLVGRNGAGEPVKVEQAEAIFRLITEQERAEAIRDAEAALSDFYKDRPIPPDRHVDERGYHLLFRALRDASPPHGPFADTHLQHKNALVQPEAERVSAAYFAFVREEFPEVPTEEDFDKMVGDAEKKS